jgi:hypothetical protein
VNWILKWQLIFFASIDDGAEDPNRREERYMLKLFCAICICLITFPALCESASNYQIATIIDVKPHPTSDHASDVVSYDVAVRVGNTIYVTLYTPNTPVDTNNVRYRAGLPVLVLIRKDTIAYNDLLGRSFEVPIISQKPAADGKQSKQ